MPYDCFVEKWVFVIRSNNWQSKHKSLIFKDRILFPHPDSCMLIAGCSRNPCRAACHGAKEWQLGNCYYGKRWNWLKLTTICQPSLPLEVARLKYTPELQSICYGYYNRFGQCNCCLGRETDSQCFLLLRQNILQNILFLFFLLLCLQEYGNSFSSAWPFEWPLFTFGGACFSFF